MKRNIYSIFTLLIAFSLLLSGCDNKPLHTETAFYLYTQVQLTTYGKLDQSIYDEIWSMLDNIDQTMSMNIDTSEINRINSQAGIAPVSVSQQTYDLIEKALDYSAIDSKFDISIGSLVSLWGIGTDTARLPDQTEIDAVLPLIDYKNIVLDEESTSVFLTTKGMQIDLGAIAKGYASDLTRDALLEHGIKDAIINYGGNIHTMGTKIDGTQWNIGVQNPDETRGLYLGILPLSDSSIVTSGSYERFMTLGDIKYHHILDPSTGYPIDNDLTAVSIITPNGVDGDAFSTLVFARGLEEGLALIESLPTIEALFITSDLKIYLSSGIKETFKLIDESFEVVR